MKHIRMIAILLITAILFVGLISCASSEEDLTGTWVAVKEGGHTFQCRVVKKQWDGSISDRIRTFNIKTLSLYSDGTARWNGEHINWSFNDKEILLSGSDNELSFKYTIKGNKLTLIVETDQNEKERIVLEKE